MPIPTLFKKDYIELCKPHAILIGWRGSIAHNMYVPNTDPNSIDDKDVMGVAVPDQEYYLGLRIFGSHGTREIYKEDNGIMWDIVVYEARKFISLLAKGNPNVLSLLWLRDNHYIEKSKAGDLLIENRDVFVGRHVYRAFTGYAYAQLQKMERGSKGGWQSARRRKMFESVGYDAKNASHLIRLLRMGIEFLKDGELYVFRDDAPQLLEIKRGGWSLEQVKAEADRGFKLAEEAYINSTLPKNVDMDKVNELCCNVINEARSSWW